jgi:signal transduction histidine kinase
MAPPYYLEWTAAPIRNAAGATTHFVALQRDISARKRAQRQVQASDARVRRSLHRLQILYEIGQAILSATSLEMIAQQAVRHIADLIPCSCASVVVFDAQANTAHTLAINFRGQVETPPASATLRPVDMTAAMHIGEPLVISQIPATGTLVASRSFPASQAPSQAFVSVPILSQDRLIGSLNLEAEHDGVLSEEYIDIAREVANMLAMAIQHTQLFHEIQAGRDRLAQLSRQLIDVQEEERRHLARELHDEIGQSLTVIQLNLHNLDGAVATPDAQASVHDSTRIAQNLLKQIRTLSLNLRPSMLDDLGLISTLRWYLDQQAQRSGLSIHFSAEDSAVAIDPQIATACFRIVQESLTNILRYAGASSVSVSVTAQDGRLELRVSDNGCGFDLHGVRAQAAGGASFGILGMEERAALLGGVCEITSAPGQGTQVRAIFALDRSPLDSARISR